MSGLFTALARPAAGNTAAPRLQRACACAGKAPGEGECEACKKKRVQRRAGDAVAPAPSVAPWASALPPDGLAGFERGGAPLAPAWRRRVEPLFGTGFGDVRVHDDAASHAAARRLNARAFTVGQHVHFAAGRFGPASREGLHLLAHELAHTVQQRGASSAVAADGEIDAPDSPLERDADAQADAVVAGRPVNALAAVPRAARVQRAAGDTTVTVTAPSGPNDCGLEHHRVIEPAVRRAEAWLATAVRRLDAFVGAPADAGNADVRDALNSHFSTTSAAHATIVRGRLNTIRTDLTQRNPFTAECHGSADTSCAIAGAYVPGDNQSMVVFCPNFFAGHRTEDNRAGTLIHEMAHALLGLNVADRAYENDRVLPRLSTAEAFDNAESHAMLAEQLGTGRAVSGNPPQDEVEDCTASTEDLIREATARAQRWNRDANNIATDARATMVADSAALFTQHLGDNLPATRSAAAQRFNRMESRLREPIDVRCDATAAPECGSRTAYRKPARDNLGLGVGLGAAIGGGLGLGVGLGVGLGAASLGLGLGLGLGLLGLGLIVGAIVGAATSRPDRVHVCPAWRAQSAPADRTEALLAAIYETYGGLDATAALANARLARALHERYIGTPPAI